MKCRTAQPSISSTFTRRMLIRLAVFCLAVSLPAIGQNTNGRILGIVTDPQGAALAGAKVTVANAATNIQRTTVTDGTGSYQVLDLPVGAYVVTVEMKGFNKAIAHPQPLDINQSLRVDIAMKVGGTTEVVQVESQSSQVETVNPTIGGTVTGKPIQELPLNGREVLDLAFTQPGVLPAPLTGYGSEKSGSFAEGFTVAGGRPDA
ncbi:MAG TPA: carboxypeptidase regulatory-like domain-containing protein, partial [Terriglobales bacterium]|nr:carboxypeptidase regulatory-like domain-containing protein [Terriglobales bacterium]